MKPILGDLKLQEWGVEILQEEMTPLIVSGCAFEDEF